MNLGEIAQLVWSAALCFKQGNTASCIALAHQAHQLLGKWLLDPSLSAEHQSTGDEADNYYWEQCEPPCH